MVPVDEGTQPLELRCLSIRHIVTVMLASVSLFGAPMLTITPTASAHTHRSSRCHTKACSTRVAWRHYKKHPLPWCTWGPESDWNPLTGASYIGKPWVRGRYRVKNPKSTAGGKYQILDMTWYGFGGSYQGRVRHPAAYASRVEQERVARRVLRGQGLGAWENC